MKFITYFLATGKVDAIRAAYGCLTEEDILKQTYGIEASLYGAIPYNGEDLTGKLIDVSTKQIVDDPSFVKSVAAPEPEVVTETP